MTSVILLDGSIGQSLIKRVNQPVTPLWSARVMLDHMDIVTALHQEYIEAGAKVLTLNTYTATPGRLKRDADISLLEPIHERAIASAKQAIKNTAVQDVRIAGCLPPLMASYIADVVPSFEECLAQYRQLVALQSDADLFLCETLSTIHEAKAAALAAQESGKDVWVSFTLDDDKPEKLRSGESFKDAVKEIAVLNVEAILINCSMPETINQALPILIDGYDVVGAYANAFQSVTPLEPGKTVASLKKRTDVTPDAYEELVLTWIDLGAQIVGGCCEVGPTHIEVLAKALENKQINVVASIKD